MRRFASSLICSLISVGTGCANRDLYVEVRDSKTFEPLRHVEVQVQQITPGKFTVHRFSLRKAETDDNGEVCFSIPEVESLQVFVITEQRQWVIFSGIGRSVWTPGYYRFADGRTHAGDLVPIEIVVATRN